MGLCKCRTVTTLFCFEHRRNVCERCVVTDHPQCVVKTYLQWLQDSEFDPNCLLCHQPFSADHHHDDNGAGTDAIQRKVIRLPCFDLFHWDCLERELAQGDSRSSLYKSKCPLCRTPVWPLTPGEASNQPWSPLLVQIHGILSTSSFAPQLPPVPPPPSDVGDDGKAVKDRDPTLTGPLGNSTQPNREMITIEVGPHDHFFSPHGHGRRQPVESKIHAPPRGRRTTMLAEDSTPPIRSIFRVLLNCLMLRNVRILGLGLSPRQTLLIVALLASLFFITTNFILPLLQPVMFE